MSYNPTIAALAARLKSAGRLKPKQIIVAAMRKLLVICFGVLKTGQPVQPGSRHASMSPADILIPLFDWGPVIPPSRSDTTPAARAAEVKEGRRPARERLVLYRSEQADTLKQFNGDQIHRLTRNTVSTAINYLFPMRPVFSNPHWLSSIGCHASSAGVVARSL